MRKSRKELRKQRIMDQQRIEYSYKVKEYLRNHSPDFMTAFCELCAKSHGRVSYDAALEILGKGFPKAVWIPEKELRLQIIAFFNETGLPFIPDDTHLYFP